MHTVSALILRRGRTSNRGSRPNVLRAVRFGIECLCFFVISTPFELEIGSGYGYTIKALAGAVLLLPRILTGQASVDNRFVWIALVALLFIAINLQNPSARAVLAFLLMLLGATLGLLKSHEWQSRLLAMVTVYIVVHLGGFALALVVFLTTGGLIDLHSLVFPGASRGHEIGAAARIAGFHNEPGTYAQWMLMAVFLRCLLMRRITSSLNIAAGASSIMTFSVWAVAGTGLLILGIALEMLFRFRVGKKIRLFLTITLLIQAVIVGMSYLPNDVLGDGFAYLQLKSELRSDSGVDKILALNELEDTIHELIVWGGPVDPGFCPHCLSPQDLGIWANFIYYFGLAPSVLLISYLFLSLYRGWGAPFLPFFIALLVWKAVFYDLLLWIIIGYTLAWSVALGRNRRDDIA